MNIQDSQVPERQYEEIETVASPMSTNEKTKPTEHSLKVYYFHSAFVYPLLADVFQIYTIYDEEGKEKFQNQGLIQKEVKADDGPKQNGHKIFAL